MNVVIRILNDVNKGGTGGIEAIYVRFTSPSMNKK